MSIHVINPNSLTHVTAGIDRALAPMRNFCPVDIVTHTLAEGPPGIETQAHVDLISGPLLAYADTLEASASAFVIACYSDPGLAALREQSGKPVFGIAESAILTAMTMGQRFGVISILNRSIPRHLRYVGAMGVTDRMAGDLALELGVAELSDEGRAFGRMVEVGRRLQMDFGADVLIMGCAGMANFRQPLEVELGCPVIDPSQAATAMAIGAIALQQTRNIKENT